jgi:VWFA-related protein
MACLRGLAKTIRIASVVFLVCGFLPITDAAQTRSPQSRTARRPAQERLQHEVTVTLKLVQAYVVDPDGNPASDLEISDFILYDNGKRQNITEFEKHFLPVPGVSFEETKPAPSRRLPTLLNRKFIFIIDYEGNDLEAVAKSRKAILHFMDNQIKPGDEIALFSFSETRGLVLHEFLTAEYQKIRAALQKAMDIPGIPGGWDFERVIFEAETVGLTPGAPGSSGQRPEQILGGSGTHSTSLALARHLQELGTVLRHIPGQKNVILFSRGFGISVLAQGTHENYVFTEMAKELASASSPVFSVDTTTGSAKAKVFADGSLEYLSGLTGGRFYHNVNYESKIAEDIQAATSNYYVLGYSIASDWDGKFHEIKVEVQKPGYKVYAQRGYFNPLPFSKLSAVEKHLRLLDLAFGEKTNPDRRLDLPMAVLPFSPDAEFNAVLIAEIPVLRIREVIGDDTELISLVSDQDKTVADSKREAINWEANDRRKAYHYSFLSLLPGSYDCRLVIRNPETGASALAAGTVIVPERKEKGLQLFPPLLMGPEPGALYIKQAAPNKKNLHTPSFFLSDVFSIDSNEYAPLLEKELSAGSEVWAAVRCALSGGSAGRVKLAAYLIDEITGEKIALPLAIMKEIEKGSEKTFFVRFRVPELDRDEYSLVFVAEDPVSGEMSIVGCDFVIK